MNGLRGVTSEQFGDVFRGGRDIGRSGEHVGEPWAVVLPGAHRAMLQERPVVKAIDLAATVCSALDVPHDDLRGSPLLQ